MHQMKGKDFKMIFLRELEIWLVNQTLITWLCLRKFFLSPIKLWLSLIELWLSPIELWLSPIKLWLRISRELFPKIGSKSYKFWRRQPKGRIQSSRNHTYSWRRLSKRHPRNIVLKSNHLSSQNKKNGTWVTWKLKDF